MSLINVLGQQYTSPAVLGDKLEVSDPLEALVLGVDVLLVQLEVDVLHHELIDKTTDQLFDKKMCWSADVLPRSLEVDVLDHDLPQLPPVKITNKTPTDVRDHVLI
jgi:hypothetical protein